MIIEIPDDNSIVKWKMNDKDEWKSAEISDLIKAYDGRPRCANCEHYVTDGIPNLYEDCLCVHPEEEYPLDSILRMKPDDFCSRFEERNK